MVINEENIELEEWTVDQCLVQGRRITYHLQRLSCSESSSCEHLAQSWSPNGDCKVLSTGWSTVMMMLDLATCSF